jgi:oligopeptide/dipeptide ABC transporter ATP-binding protein
LDIMLRLRDESDISFLYITHDLSTAYQIGDEIYLLFQGSTVEKGDTVKVIENPQHPYVQQLIASVPVLDPDQRWDSHISLPGDEESRAHAESGCRFYPRCPQRMDRCLTVTPPLYQIDGLSHQVACYLYEGKPHSTE